LVQSVTPEALARVVPVVPSRRQWRLRAGRARDFGQRAVCGVIGIALSVLFLQSAAWRSLSLLFFATYPVAQPWFLAARENARLRAYPYAALFRARVAKVDGRKAVIRDYDGRTLTTDIVPPQSANIRDPVAAIVFSDKPTFTRITAATDFYVPASQRFVGPYPYLHRPTMRRLLTALNETEAEDRPAN